MTIFFDHSGEGTARGFSAIPSSTMTPSGPQRKTSFRLWNSIASFRSLTPLALSLATSASRLSTAKQTWLNPSLLRLPIGEGVGLAVFE